MQELSLASQMEIQGGSATGWFLCIVIGTAIYKVFRSSKGRVSIPRLISIEWQ